MLTFSNFNAGFDQGREAKSKKL